MASTLHPGLIHYIPADNNQCVHMTYGPPHDARCVQCGRIAKWVGENSIIVPSSVGVTVLIRCQCCGYA